jgi:hypothetical protein
MNHDLFRINNVKINTDRIFLKLNLNKYNNIILAEYQQILEDFKLNNHIKIIIDDDFNWEIDDITKEWNILMVNSLFVADDAYASVQEYKKWGNKYAIGYFFLLLSSQICWDNASIKRLYFDDFDKKRFESIKVLIYDWETNFDIYKTFKIKNFINKSNLEMIDIKWKLIKLVIKILLQKNIINNDFDLYLYFFILASSIKNDFTLKLNTFEMITYNFNNSNNEIIKRLYVHQKTGNTELDMKYNKIINNLGRENNLYVDYFHVNYGYIGQLLRIIAVRDSMIRPKTLILLRDGHATSPSIYEKINMKRFIKSQKIYKIGTTTEYTAPWHKLGELLYRKGILMGTVTVKKHTEEIPFDDEIWYKSWGKAFDINDEKIIAVDERIKNTKFGIYNRQNVKIEALDMPFIYGMEEFLGDNLAYDNNGLTNKYTKDDFIIKINKLIDWSVYGWFLNIVTELWNKYPFVSIATKYIYCKFYDLFKDMTTMQFYFVCDHIMKKETVYDKDDYIEQSLAVLPSIFNIIHYVSLNSQNDLASYIFVKDLFDIENEEERKQYIYMIESKKEKCDFYKSIDYGFLKKLIYKENDELNTDCNLYNIGFGWQNKFFRNSDDYFDPLQIPYEINIDIKNLQIDKEEKGNKYFEKEILENEYINLNNIYSVLKLENNLNAELLMDIQKKCISNLNKIYNIIGKDGFIKKRELLMENSSFIAENIKSSDISKLLWKDDKLIKQISEQSTDKIIIDFHSKFTDDTLILCNTILNSYKSKLYEQFKNIKLFKTFYKKYEININQITDTEELLNNFYNYKNNILTSSYSNSTNDIPDVLLIDAPNYININKIKNINENYVLEHNIQKKYMKKYLKYKKKYLSLKNNL